MAELFDAARRGDRGGQEEVARLIRTFAQGVCRGSGPRGAPEFDWEDVAQEALRRFFTMGLDQYRGQGSERSYLYTIVKSTFIQLARTAARRRRREESAASDGLAAPHDPTLKLHLASILQRLSPDCRDLMERVFLYGEPYSALALELEMAESSVRAKLSRCLQRARMAARRAGNT